MPPRKKRPAPGASPAPEGDEGEEEREAELGVACFRYVPRKIASELKNDVRVVLLVPLDGALALRLLNDIRGAHAPGATPAERQAVALRAQVRLDAVDFAGRDVCDLWGLEESKFTMDGASSRARPACVAPRAVAHGWIRPAPRPTRTSMF